jgi:hypothetical protein
VFGGFFLNARWESAMPALGTLKSEGTDGLLQENG